MFGPRIRERDETMELRWSGHRARGIFFLVFGVGLAVLAILYTRATGPGDAIGFSIVALLPLAGAALSFVGGRAVVNRQARSASTQWRLLGVGIRRQAQTQGQWGRVTLRHISQGTGRGKTYAYVVRLEAAPAADAPNPHATLICTNCRYDLCGLEGDPVRCPECGALNPRPRPGDPQIHVGSMGVMVANVAMTAGEIEVFCATGAKAARRVAERVSRFLNLPLVDFSETTYGVQRRPDELDRGVTERLRAAGKLPSWPAPLAENRIRVVENADGVQFVLPRGGQRVLRVYLWLGGLGAFFSVMWLLSRLTDKRQGWRTDDWAVLIVWAAALTSALVLTVLRKRVDASPRGLRTTLHVLLPVARGSIPLPELEEFELERVGGALVARSDRRSIDFGHWLTPQEREWLHSAVLAAFAGHLAPNLNGAPAAAQSGTTLNT